MFETEEESRYKNIKVFCNANKDNWDKKRLKYFNMAVYDYFMIHSFMKEKYKEFTHDIGRRLDAWKKRKNPNRDELKEKTIQLFKCAEDFALECESVFKSAYEIILDMNDNKKWEATIDKIQHAKKSANTIEKELIKRLGGDNEQVNNNSSK